MGTITITGREAASNADLMNGTRLLSVPMGKLKIVMQANANDATNNFTCSLTLPSGEAPWLDIQVPGSNPALTGVLDERQVLAGVFDIIQEGHVTLSITEAGTALLDWQITSFS